MPLMIVCVGEQCNALAGGFGKSELPAKSSRRSPSLTLRVLMGLLQHLELRTGVVSGGLKYNNGRVS